MKIEIEGSEEEIKRFMRNVVGERDGNNKQLSSKMKENEGKINVRKSPEYRAKMAAISKAIWAKRKKENMQGVVETTTAKPKQTRQRIKKYKVWTKEEDKQLKELYAQKSAKRIAKLLHRTLNSVYARAYDLQITKNLSVKHLGGTLSEAGRKSISESQKERWRKYREAHGKFTIASKVSPHEQPMLRQKAVVPLTREEQGKKLLNGVKQEKQKKVEFPDFMTGASIELVKSVFKLFTLGDRERRLSYANDAYTLGIEGVAVWNSFVGTVLARSEEVCAALNVPNRLKIEYAGKVSELVYEKA